MKYHSGRDYCAMSAHFSNKQYARHCTIVKPFDKQYNYHLSDDTKQDGIFVDHVLRDLIIHSNNSNEDLRVQSDNASFQCKNKHSFGLQQPLADEFNVRIIRTYGAPGYGKEAIDAMSSIGVKNILRKDIVTQDVFLTILEHGWVSCFKESTVLMKYHSGRDYCANISERW